MPAKQSQLLEDIDMKKTVLVASLMLILASGPAMAQRMGGGSMMGGQATPQMMEQQQTQQSAPPESQYYNQYMYPGMMGNYGYGMGTGMMGGYGGYGMGPGMMGGYGMGPGMMGGYGGYGMGPGMMGFDMHQGMMGSYGCGMGPGMMGYYSPEQYGKQFKENQDFLNETKELRKKMHALKFDYAEALRNPETDKKDLGRINAEMESIWKLIDEKRKSVFK